MEIYGGLSYNFDIESEQKIAICRVGKFLFKLTMEKLKKGE